MVISNSTLDVKKVIDSKSETEYASDTVHLEITNSNGVSLVHNPAVVPPSGNTNGSIIFSDVSLLSGRNTIKMFLYSNVYLDLDGLKTKLGTSYVRVVDATSTEITL